MDHDAEKESIYDIFEECQTPTTLKTKEEQKDENPATEPTKRKRRKGQRNENLWKSNVRKTKRARGEAYLSTRKKLVPAKRVKNLKNCLQNCRLKCNTKITDEDRQKIFKEYYSLSTEEKRDYLLSLTEMCKPNRRRSGKDEGNSRKLYTFKYYLKFNDEKILVCKYFFLGTLSISQKPIYYVHSINCTADNLKEVPRNTKRDDKDFVREHINSFPRIWTKEKWEYLESTLTIRKMYSLYLEKMQALQRQPVKESMYRQIFCNDFKISFSTPRKDFCEQCESYKKNQKELSEKYMQHVQEKTKMEEEKAKDKKDERNILCFDFENILTCPKAELEDFYYKSKLSVFNVTAYFSRTKQVYCAVWPENLTGRNSNEIASSLYKILEIVIGENPEIHDLIIWCNSGLINPTISLAIAHFIKSNESLKKVTVKFCVSEHSNLPEIDVVHNCIDRVLKKTEYWSPVSLLRLLKVVNLNKPYEIIQMEETDFKDFEKPSASFNFFAIPFSQVTSIEFNNSFCDVKYKTSFLQKEFDCVYIRPVDYSYVFQITELKCNVDLAAMKKETLKLMMKWMPKVDMEYYLKILTKKENVSESEFETN